MIKVFVYRNLHRDCWSAKAMDGPLKGKVIYHAKEIPLWGCDFKVSQAGRARVLREKSKNVHAGVMGYMYDDMLAPAIKAGDRITYNPYRYNTFVEADTGLPVFHADYACMKEDKSVWAVGLQ
jgi:hypothetical protein